MPKRKLQLTDRIVIAGGGVGGLAAALALQTAGFSNVVVLERDAHFSVRRHGYGMTLSTTNSGLGALGILDECMRLDVPSESHYVFAESGEVLGYFGNAFIGGDCGQRGNLRVPRQQLRRLLLERLAPGTVRWGCHVSSYAEEGAGGGGEAAPRVAVAVSDGSREDAALLVAADGIHSAIRKQRSDNELNYLGVLLVVGITALRHPLIERRGFYTLDAEQGARLFTMPFTAPDASAATAGGVGQTAEATHMWQLSIAMDEAMAKQLSKGDAEALSAELLRRCAHWHEPVCEMIRTTPAASFFSTPLYDRDALPKLPKGKQTCVTFVGDAAHPMSPFKGQGANSALADAPGLAKWLQKAPVSTAIACYEREMIARSNPRVMASREAATKLHTKAVTGEKHGVAGAGEEAQVVALLRALVAEKVDASSGAGLDDAVRAQIARLAKKRPLSRDRVHTASDL